MERELLELGFKKYNKFYELVLKTCTIQVIDDKVYLFENIENTTDAMYNKYSYKKVKKLIDAKIKML
mgnify:CR=1 FL=1